MAVSVGFISLGCSKNLVDSQVMAGFLKEGKISFAETPETADIIIVNTCAFIEAAREEAAEAILSVCEHKTNGACKGVVVAGCMVQRYKEQLLKAFPDVDAFIGIDELDQVAQVIDRVAQGERCGVLAKQGPAKKVYNPAYPTLLFTGGPFSYLKIADGCNHRCAYCAIPLIRGNFRSRDMDAIVNEAQSMINAGVKEINLISQDSLMYGADHGGKPLIVELVQRLDQLKGDFWLRILYGYPAGVTPALIDLFNSAKHLVNYLDLPIQHSHPEILTAMNRGKAIEATTTLAERLRAAIPGVTLRTTCLVGFPGETTSHVKHLEAFLKKAQFDHVGVFVYSPEEGTAADAWEAPDEKVANARAKKLMDLQKTIVETRLATLKGTTTTAVLLRQKNASTWIGRTPRQAPEVDGETLIKNVPPTAKAGDFISIVITGGEGYDLHAKACMP